MAYSSEIDKLLARYKENPKGRNFAPLADAYRKAGQLDEALRLCRHGLELHPDYISAHIVLGRCLLDKKDDVSAEEAFRRVLTLDPENVIALRMLGDIAVRSERPADAVEWLSRLLNADPMNSEAADALAQARARLVLAAKAAEAVTPVAAPESEFPLVVQEETVVELQAATPDAALVEPEPALPGQYAAGPPPPPPPQLEIETFAAAEAPTAAMTQPDFEVERASAAAPAPRPPREPPESVVPEAEPAPLETFEVTAAAVGETPVLSGLEVDETEDIIAPEDVAPLDGLARTQYEGSGMFRVEAASDAAPGETEARSPAPPPEEGSASIDLPLIMPEEAEEEARARLSSAPLAAPPLPEPEPARMPRPAALGDDDGAVDQAALSAAEPVVTETMAELYRSQGHLEDALRVYQALLADRPHDVRLAAKVAELGGPARPMPETFSPPSRRGPSAGGFLRALFRGEAVPELSEPEPDAVPEAEPTVEAEPALEAEPAPEAAPEFTGPAAPAPVSAPLDLGTVLDDAFEAGGEEAEAGPDAVSASGAPTQPARDSFSLESVFGEGPRESEARAVVESEPAQAPPRPTGFSFDEFFGGGGQAATPGKPSHARTREDSGGSSAAPEPDEDLDQFQDWLRGLKT